jgi:hypothetical protein
MVFGIAKTWIAEASGALTGGTATSAVAVLTLIFHSLFPFLST